jgi:hypothetical protein
MSRKGEPRIYTGAVANPEFTAWFANGLPVELPELQLETWQILPWFCDADQVAALCPEIDWSARVTARIEHLKAWGRPPDSDNSILDLSR